MQVNSVFNWNVTICFSDILICFVLHHYGVKWNGFEKSSSQLWGSKICSIQWISDISWLSGKWVLNLSTPRCFLACSRLKAEAVGSEDTAAHIGALFPAKDVPFDVRHLMAQRTSTKRRRHAARTVSCLSPPQLCNLWPFGYKNETSEILVMVTELWF